MVALEREHRHSPPSQVDISPKICQIGESSDLCSDIQNNIFHPIKFFVIIITLLSYYIFSLFFQYICIVQQDLTSIYFNNQGFVIILSLPGPTPIHFTGTFKDSSINSTYFLQLSGNASYDLVCSIEVFHPGSVTYSTSTFSRISKSATKARKKIYQFNTKKASCKKIDLEIQLILYRLFYI